MWQAAKQSSEVSFDVRVTCKQDSKTILLTELDQMAVLSPFVLMYTCVLFFIIRQVGATGRALRSFHGAYVYDSL